MDSRLAAYATRRVIQAIPLMFVVLTINFALVHLAPGDPITFLAGDQGSQQYFAEQRAKYGLDLPIYEQYGRYLLHAARGDFGYSFSYGQGVFAVILERVSATLLLMITAQLFAVVLGVFGGVVAARHRGGWAGTAIRTGAALGYALPVFWVGQLFILFFAFRLDLFPTFGMESPKSDYSGLRRLADIGHHLFLPALAVSLAEIGLLIRITDASLRDLEGAEFVRTARAKGLGERAVTYRHMLRNALLPIVTVIGGRIGTLLTGAVLVEIVFAWPGLGRLLFQAAVTRDYPLLMAMVVISSASVVVANIVTDIAYALLDPRVTYG
ncbi:MAG: ABC transporter permease [Anaerolineaceae bacterium]